MWVRARFQSGLGPKLTKVIFVVGRAITSAFVAAESTPMPLQRHPSSTPLRIRRHLLQNKRNCHPWTIDQPPHSNGTPAHAHVFDGLCLFSHCNFQIAPGVYPRSIKKRGCMSILLHRVNGSVPFAILVFLSRNDHNCTGFARDLQETL